MKWSLYHKSDGKAYMVFSQTLRVMFVGFFRNVHIDRLTKIPEDKPVLIAANHPTAFLDPVLMGVYFRPPVYYMTRGDVFKKPFFRKLLESVNMFPVYRTRDGYTGRDRNDQVFDYCRKQLVDRKIVTIFVEGEHHLDKHVRPTQKGIARIAFQTYEQEQLEELQVLPIGFSYRYGDREREVAMVNIGEPIYIRDYWEQYQDSPAAAVRTLCLDIHEKLKVLCCHVENPDYCPVAEDMLTLHRNNLVERLVPVVHFNKKAFDGEKAICDQINVLDDQVPALGKKVEAYFARLQKLEVDDRGLMHPEYSSFLRLLVLILVFPFYALGGITSWPVRYLSKYLTRKKVKKVEFYSSVLMGIGQFIGLVYYGLLFLIALISFNPVWIGIALLLPLLAWVYALYKSFAQAWALSWKAKRHPERQQLLIEREAIWNAFQNK
ncbi:MAG: 1-acyl-sn-glycerol-3-phosphate acyltransferase [Saprospiraceae bacterium]